MRKSSILLLLLACIVLTSCVTIEENYAPVTEISIIEPIPKKGIHRVLPDETLYSIAWRYGLDYRVLAKHNNISTPYAITEGQIIYLNKHTPTPKPPVKTRQQKPPAIAVSPTMPPKATKSIIEKEPTGIVHHWQWPALGTVIGTFSSTNKGINIAGHLNEPIIATASGKVVYSGHGLRGYGNLIIIKHNSMFLTAYAHNNTAFVKSGDWVNRGQQIAGMGSTGAQRVMLHFEIRRNGKPVNPLLYLGKRVNS